ncbi:MFS transporter [Novosphingobium umbonatum]|uniref:MFS transporter n=1 Tax=Novosphingobium umbonatum TaxID=1908524 RepID=A0A3S2Y8E3_9SPHN|nr:MFS transporter [Novosphingobium umbonatum]RVU05874.1 MFS transporter [Novosphingobium umbonatum]
MSHSGKGTMLGLAQVAALGTMAIHMLVPALPALAHEFAVDASGAQRAVSVYMIGLGLAQLLVGPAVDRLGRRPVLLAGLCLYIAGAAGSACAPSLPLLLAARAMQATGGAAGMVTARVMVGDLFGADEAARRQATLMTIVLISPALAPVVGGVLAAHWGWRAIPALLGLAALGVLILVAPRLPRQAPVGRVQASALTADYASLLRNSRFRFATLAMTMASCTLYMFLASAPFLLRSSGVGSSAVGLWLLVVAAASIAGTRMVRLFAGGAKALSAGASFILGGTMLGATLAFAGGVGPLALVGPVLLVGVGAGMAGPSAMAIVVFAEEGLAGTATSLAGATQMLGSAAATLGLGLVAPVSALRLDLLMVGTGILCFYAAWQAGINYEK